MKGWLLIALCATAAAGLAGDWRVGVVVAVGLMLAWAAFWRWLLGQGVNPVVDLTPDRPKASLLHDKFHESKLPADIDVVVIGSGLGGLTAAALLARAGRRVVVLEQHPDVCGGSTHTFNLKGYRFDSGLHYSVPWNGPLLQLTALKNKAEVPSFDLMGDETGMFDSVVIGSDEPFAIKHGEKHLDQLYKMFPEEAKAIDEYLRVSNDTLVAVQIFIISKLLPNFLQPLFWKLVPRRYVDPNKETAEVLLGRLTKCKRLISLLCGLWIDTGGRPDKASFLLTAAVFRGLPKEGGCYPAEGAASLARTLVPVIEKYGGRVLIDAPVGEITFEEGVLSGVRLQDGTHIQCREVVSGAGYHTTFQKLVPEEITQRYNIPRTLPLKNSAGFVMCNIGIRGGASELGITNTNLWYLPADADGDIFVPMRKYFDSPEECEPPIMITFPSVKDKSWDSAKTCCQMLAMAEWEWFAEFAEEPSGNRGEEYEAKKKRWGDKCVEILYRYYPKTKGLVEMVDVSTPLSINHYLAAPGGGAVGLDVNADRFYNYEGVQKHLNAVTPIPNLYLTGHDIVMPGVVMAQIAGVITAFRMLGFFAAARFVLQSIFLLDRP